MRHPVFNRVSAALVALAVLLVTSCAGVSGQVARPVQVPQNVPPADIPNLVASSLGQLNYAVVEMNPSSGTVRAERRVPNDVWNRVTSMRVDVAPGNAGGNVLIVEASSCPGCIPQATYDPEFMINEFQATFDLWLRFAGYYGQQQSPGQGGQRYQEPARLQAAPGGAGPASPQLPSAPVRQPPPAVPALRINSVEISPVVVAAGSTFDVVADYMAFDPAIQDREVPVQFGLSILRDGRVLYSPNTVEIKSPNKGAFKRIEHMSASKEQGRYTVRVTIRYKDLTAERSADLEIR